MPETYKAYRVWEVAIRSKDFSRETKSQSGDIVAVRQPMPRIGFREGKTFLWLRLYGLDDADMIGLTQTIELADQIIEKRRYTIPFDRLAQVMPSFSVSRATDPDDLYQPFQIYSEDDLERLADNVPPLFVAGLVFDRQFMRYL